jgi:hypothetical protein
MNDFSGFVPVLAPNLVAPGRAVYHFGQTLSSRFAMFHTGCLRTDSGD